MNINAITQKRGAADSVRTRKWLQATIATVMGLFLLDTLLSGRIAFYINETRFEWLSWLATAILLIMGVLQIHELLTTRPPAPVKPKNEELINTFAHDTGGSGHEHAGHAHGGGGAPTWIMLGIVVIPLLMGVLIPAKPLGATAVANTGLSASFTGGVTNVLDIAPTDRNVLDWIRAFNTSKDYSEFNGQSADFIGFVYRDITLDEQKNFMLARFTVSCCVADASALGILIQDKDAQKWEQDAWVRVRGKFEVQAVKDQKTPVLIAESVEAVERPKTPYLYP
jgi:putative membrane protein